MYKRIMRLMFAFASVCILAFQPIMAGNPSLIPKITMEIQIPRSSTGDKGTYFLLGVTKTKKIVITLHKRVGPGSVGYTACELDFSRNLIRDIGYSEISPEEIKYLPTKWYPLVPGSSKSDLFEFVRNRKN